MLTAVYLSVSDALTHSLADSDFRTAYNNQAELIKACENTSTPEEVEETLKRMRQAAGTEGLAKVFADHKLDVLIAPSDCKISALTAATGYPIGVVPFRYLPNGQPQGLTVVAQPFEEHKMIHFMRAFEATFPKRRVPPLLDDSVR